MWVLLEAYNWKFSSAQEYSQATVNPIQAGVFWNHIGWPPPFLLYLLSNYHQTWHASTMPQNLSKTVKVKPIMTSLWRLWRHLCFLEYQKLMKTANIYIGAAFLSFIIAFIQSYSNLAGAFNTSIALEQYSWIKNNRSFPSSDDVINLLMAFLANMIPFLSNLSKILLFQHSLWKSMP